MSEIKGVNITHTRSFIENAYGIEGWASVAAELTKETRDAIESIIAVGWYPGHLHVDLLRAVKAALDDGSGTVVARAAEHDAAFDITRIHRVLFRFANPGFLIERVQEIWGRYFTTGSWTMVRPTPTTLIASLEDFAIVDPLYCAYLTAYTARLWELVGAKDVQNRHTLCRARGAAMCRWEASWR
jgi:hypothetical protein